MRAKAWLVQSGYVDFDGKPTEKFKEEGIDEIAIERLPEELKSRASAIDLLVRSVYDPKALDKMIGNGLERKVSVNKLNQNFERRAFQELWDSINTKHTYTVDFDSQELIDKAVASVNEKLVVSELAYAMTVGSQENQIERESVESANQFSVKRTSHEKVDTGAITGVTYDLLGEIAAMAKITRRTVATILSAIEPHKFALFVKNPEEFIAKVAKLIVEQKANMIVDHIEYHPIDGKYDSAIFTESMPQNVTKAMAVSKGIQDYVIPDSDIEANFAHDLDKADEVEVYAKLPRSFTIPTPVGNYAPDWAIAFKDSEKVQHVYFVAETKGTLESLELRGVERAKIACAKKLFNEASTAGVRYHEVTDYKDLLSLVTGGAG